MAEDARVLWNDFKTTWQATDYDRCIGNTTLEEVMSWKQPENLE